MNILLDETKLENLLLKRKEQIGNSSDLWAELLAVVTYIVSLFCSDFHGAFGLQPSTLQTIANVVAIVFLFVLTVQIIKRIRNKYDYEMLYEDITNMNQIKHYFSLVAIKDDYEQYPNRFLVYYDQSWKCWFFPNFRTKEEDNEKFIVSKLSNYLHIKEDDISLQYITEKVQPKFSIPDQIQKVYSHKLYQANISDFPEEIQDKDFIVGQTKYRWMTIAEMEADPVIKEKNSDVVSLVKDSIA